MFPALHVTPREMLLLPDAVFQVKYEGGPSGAQVSVVFSMQNETVATVDAVGLVRAHSVGTTVLLARAEVSGMRWTVSGLC